MEDKYTYEDYLLFEECINHQNPSKDEMDRMFRLYKKYIDQYITHYKTDCDCSGSITQLYSLMKQWFELQKQFFKQK
jgi:hypothetical protein